MLTGAFTHCVVDKTSTPLTLGRAVIGTNTVLMPSSRPTSAEVLRGMYQKLAQQIHLGNHRNEATLDTKGSRTTKISRDPNLHHAEIHHFRTNISHSCLFLCNLPYIYSLQKIFRFKFRSKTMEFAQWLPPPHALPSSAQNFSPPGK